MGRISRRSEAFFGSVLTSGQVANLYSNETGFTAGLTTGYVGPGDNAMVGNENSYSPGLTSQKVLQLQWLSQAFSLRKAYAGYEGPALNACQGQGAVSCEDIGWVNNTLDTATLSAFCGPVSGLNNCTVETWYNEALNQAATPTASVPESTPRRFRHRRGRRSRGLGAARRRSRFASSPARPTILPRPGSPLTAAIPCRRWRSVPAAPPALARSCRRFRPPRRLSGLPPRRIPAPAAPPVAEGHQP